MKIGALRSENRRTNVEKLAHWKSNQVRSQIFALINMCMNLYSDDELGFLATPFYSQRIRMLINLARKLRLKHYSNFDRFVAIENSGYFRREGLSPFLDYGLGYIHSLDVDEKLKFMSFP